MSFMRQVGRRGSLTALGGSAFRHRPLQSSCRAVAEPCKPFPKRMRLVPSDSSTLPHRSRHRSAGAVDILADPSFPSPSRYASADPADADHRFRCLVTVASYQIACPPKGGLLASSHTTAVAMDTTPLRSASHLAAQARRLLGLRKGPSHQIDFNSVPGSFAFVFLHSRSPLTSQRLGWFARLSPVAGGRLLQIYDLPTLQTLGQWL